MTDQYDEQARGLCADEMCLLARGSGHPLVVCESCDRIAAALRELGQERDALSKVMCDMSDCLLEVERERDQFRALVVEHHAINVLEKRVLGAPCPVCVKRCPPELREEMGLTGEPGGELGS